MEADTVTLRGEPVHTVVPSFNFHELRFIASFRDVDIYVRKESGPWYLKYLLVWDDNASHPSTCWWVGVNNDDGRTKTGSLVPYWDDGMQDALRVCELLES